MKYHVQHVQHVQHVHIMFRASEHDMNMKLNMTCSDHVQYTSFMSKSCFGLFSACSSTVEVLLNMNILNMNFMFWYMISCTRTWWNMLKHDNHVQNMTFMFRTWQSCSEHDNHVQNMTIMFRTWQSSCWTWQSCSEHDHHVQNMTIMFRTWQSCSEHDNHVQNMTFMFRTWP